MEEYIFNFALLFILLGLLSFIVKLLRQPIIISYVLAGFFFSIWAAHGSDLGGQILLLAEIGITFLLFLMGLEFDFKNIKFLGKKLVILTAVQTALLFLVGLSISLFFQFTMLEAVYLALFFVFSSTLLVAKWVEDKKETTTLHGRLIIGTLIVQDLFAIISLTILSAVQKTTLFSVLLIPLGGIALVVAAYLFVKYLLNHLLKFACRFPELLFVFSLGVCFSFTLLSVSVGYSPAIGAFIAGVALANSNYKTEIHSRLKPLVIFFNILFFVGMGFQLNLDFSLGVGLVIFFFCLLNFLVKPLLFYLTTRRGGYDLKSSALLAMHLSQFSEFGIILINVGLASGVISPSLLTISIVSLLASMILSSYLIRYDKYLFKYLERFLLKLEKFFQKSAAAETSHNLLDYNVLFFGYSGLGQEVSAKLSGLGKKVLFVENDPVNIEQLKKEQVNYLYNSLTNPYFFDQIDLKKAEIVVSSLLDLDENLILLKRLKNENSSTVAIVSAKNIKDSLQLYDNGADYVICSSTVNEEQVSVLIEDYTADINKVITKKVNEVIKLKKRSERAPPTEFFDIDTFFMRMLKKDNWKNGKENVQNKVAKLLGKK